MIFTYRVDSNVNRATEKRRILIASLRGRNCRFSVCYHSSKYLLDLHWKLDDADVIYCRSGLDSGGSDQA